MEALVRLLSIHSRTFQTLTTLYGDTVFPILRIGETLLARAGASGADNLLHLTGAVCLADSLKYN